MDTTSELKTNYEKMFNDEEAKFYKNLAEKEYYKNLVYSEEKIPTKKVTTINYKIKNLLTAIAELIDI